jgi:hypothetical protein
VFTLEEMERNARLAYLIKKNKNTEKSTAAD